MTKLRLRSPAGRRAGFSLTELSLSVFLLGSMTLVAGFATDRCFGMFRQQRAEQEVSIAVGRALQRIVKELAFAGYDGLAPKPAAPFDTETLTYRACAGYDTDAAETDWDVERTIRFEYDVGEVDDDVDNDGDGLVDEGLVVLIENEGEADERRTVLAHGVREYLQGEQPDGDDDNGNGLVDEQGLSFAFSGEVLTVRLSLQGVGPGGAVVIKTMQTGVFVRN